jgi:DNA replication factor GINS
MYAELNNAWKKELAHKDLQQLTPDFYVRVAAYLKRLTEEGRMLDKKTMRAKLLKTEKENAAKMVLRMAELRYHKLLNQQFRGALPATLLSEERAAFESLLTCSEKYHEFVEKLLRGQLVEARTGPSHDILVVRFFKNIPALVGADMKTYGPFKVEDVASLPAANSNILAKQGLAVKIETK